MSQFLSYIGWWFLPNLVTSWVQAIYYAVVIRAGDPKPAPGSARHEYHQRIIKILVVAAYLVYSVYEADYELRAAPTFYQELSLPVTASERDIKSRFRRLAALHHPDKAGSGSDNAAAAMFIHLKLASDTLQDAARRFAYERFGPDVVDWQKCVTIRDHVSRGVLSGILPHYAVIAAANYALGLAGYLSFGKFYRWLIVAIILVFELHTVTRPTFTPPINLLNAIVTRLTSRPPYLPFQVIQLTRRISVTVYIAIVQIGPLLVQHFQGRQQLPPDSDMALQQGIQRLETMSRQLDTDATRLMDTQLAPFKGDVEAINNLRGKVREWLVQNTIRADPMVRDALGSSLRRRRMDVPSGARGNR
ncbi:hypothetical protein CDD81_7129 [Ophiocordyceps australis]|uniref:J domain-containing protein n=1 Tax=Ophiocordyceps australis TaxID=1399860 RepID=A0A2C5Y5G8_9HYPO|nr:hypothetical protein CDD81_7129 [Ophiocordyceps australis]